MGHDFVIGDYRHIDQREVTTVQPPGECGLVKGMQPAHGIRIRRDHAMIEQHGNDQRQLVVPRFQVALHGGNSVAHHAKSHMFIRGTLMFNEGVNITVPRSRFERVEHVRVASAQVVFNKTARFQP
ncbi:Uncharacterised protein [Yersinia enterocolitica]|nr:Uncharacterised protein [Yersinia enterocolitica]